MMTTSKRISIIAKVMFLIAVVVCGVLWIALAYNSSSKWAPRGLVEEVDPNDPTKTIMRRYDGSWDLYTDQNEYYTTEAYINYAKLYGPRMGVLSDFFLAYYGFKKRWVMSAAVKAAYLAAWALLMLILAIVFLIIWRFAREAAKRSPRDRQRRVRGRHVVTRSRRSRRGRRRGVRNRRRRRRRRN